MTYFGDTFYFLAVLNSLDGAHQKSRAIVQMRPGPIITTQWVLTELADAMCSPPQRRLAIDLIQRMKIRPDFTIIPATTELFDSGFDLYSKRPDKQWSLTDCISFVVMRRQNILNALTGDHHFEQAGFTALLK